VKRLAVAILCCASVAHAKPQPVALDSLPALDVPKGAPRGGAKISVAVADADASALLSILADQLLIADPATPVDVSGRLDKVAPGAAAAAIAAAAGVTLPKPLRAGGTATVDLQFTHAPAADVLRILADVSRKNLVLATANAPTLTIHAKRVAALTAADAMAKQLGLDVTKHGTTWFLHPHDQAPDPELLAVPGAIAVDTNGAPLGALVGAIATLTQAKISAPCDSGTVSFRLRGAQIGDVLAAGALATGAPISLLRDDPCVTPATDPEQLRAARLVAIVTSGSHRLALFTTRNGALIADDELVSIDAAGVELGEQPIVLHPLDTSARPADPLHDRDHWRLAATITGAHASAIFESDHGELRFFAARCDEMCFEVAADHVRVSARGGGSPFEIPLAR